MSSRRAGQPFRTHAAVRHLGAQRDLAAAQPGAGPGATRMPLQLIDRRRCVARCMLAAAGSLAPGRVSAEYVAAAARQQAQVQYVGRKGSRVGS